MTYTIRMTLEDGQGVSLAAACVDITDGVVKYTDLIAATQGLVTEAKTHDKRRSNQLKSLVTTGGNPSPTQAR